MEDVGGPLKDEESVGTASYDRSANTDDAEHNVAYFTLDHLRSPFLNCDLFSEGEDWSELLPYVLEREQLLQVFQNLPNASMAIFRATQRSSPRPSFSEQDYVGMLENHPTRDAFRKPLVR